MPDAYTSLIATTKEIALLASTGSVLHWDEETHMPPKGAEHRGNQSALLARMTHEQFTSPKIGELIAAVEQSTPPASGDVEVNVREIRREYDKATKIPASLVEEMSKTAVMAHQAWIDARKKAEFAIFKPWLKKVV